MRSLLRNQQPVFFKLYEREEEIIDEYGNPTGSYIPKYSNLKSAMLCVSPNKGSSEVEMFGSVEDYDRTMTTADTKCQIDEDSIPMYQAEQQRIKNAKMAKPREENAEDTIQTK